MSKNPASLSVSQGLQQLQRNRFKEKITTFLFVFVVNVSLLVLTGSYVIYTLVNPSTPEPMVFVKQQKVTPPPVKPPAKGGDAARSLADPSLVIHPPTVSTPSMIQSLQPSIINFAPTSVSITAVRPPTLPAPSGSGMGSGTSNSGITQSNPFGDNPTSGTVGLIGELYDLKQTPDGQPTDIAIAPPESLDHYDGNFLSFPQTQNGLRVLREYVRSWDQSILDKYYKAPVQLEAEQIFIPSLRSEEATKAFGVADKVTARRWVIHYHGTVVAPKSGRFRFLGFGDDVLVVRLGDTNVLDGSSPDQPLCRSADTPYEGIPGPNGHELSCGKWFDLEAGQATTLDILIGEGPGGFSGFTLQIEEEGDTSPKGDYPVFQLAATPLPKLRSHDSAFTGKTMVFGAQ